MKIGEFLQQNMDKKCMTQAELSRRSGVPASTISSMINRNNDRVAIEMMLKICEVLGCDIEDYINSMKTGSPKHMPIEFTEKYYALDTFGKDIINTILEKEYDRCQSQSKNT